MITRFEDRGEAGRLLAKRLTRYANRSDVIVLALPRGGVPVGFQVAEALHAPLDVFLVRKLGLPGHEELAMGAIATGGVRVLNDELVRSLGIPEETINTVTEEQEQELHRREWVYRGHGASPAVKGKTVILVDDGVATGSTMKAAVEALRRQHPLRIIIAVPTAAPSAYEELSKVSDDMIALIIPEDFYGVGQWYINFHQTTDQEVINLLERAALRRAQGQSCMLNTTS